MKRGAGAVKRKSETKKSGKGGEEIKAKLKKKKKDGTKNEIKKKQKKMKKKANQKGNLRQTTSSACSNLTCLTALVSVLKFEKDTVRNFLAQEKRTNSKLVLMQNKQNRSDKYMGTAKFLEKRLGETSAHKSDGPLCKGSYNTSEGIKASEVAHWLEDCQSTIDTACAPHENINASQKELLKNCSDVMHAFKERSEACQNLTTNCSSCSCSCWQSLEADELNSVKGCRNVAKDLENSIKTDTRLCKQAFINCSQTEDEALEYMIKCYTSKTQVEKNIQELLQIKDAASKLKTAQEAVVSSSKQANGDSRSRGKRQKNSEVVSCATYITEVETVDKLYLSSSLIGKGEEIVLQSTVIVQQTVTTCTSVQIVSINQNIQLLTTVIVQITTVITQYQKVLSTLTGSTIDTSQITTMTLPPNAGIVTVAATTTTTTAAPVVTTTTTAAP